MEKYGGWNQLDYIVARVGQDGMVLALNTTHIHICHARSKRARRVYVCSIRLWTANIASLP